MTRLIIEGLESRAGLLSAISVVLEAMNEDGAFDIEEHMFRPQHNAEPPVPTPSHDAVTPPPTPYVPCPARGAHTRLTDCWMCWSDVMRGAALEPEVLTLEAWRSPNP